MLVTLDESNNKTSENIVSIGGDIIAGKRFEGMYTDKWYFYDYDLRGSVTSILDPDGVYTSGYQYDAFGNSSRSGDSDFKNEMEFTGSISDTSSGLYYMNARYYNPSTGRFLTQDAAGGDAWTNNLYAYCGNNPVNFIDPTGYREIIADDGHGGLITAPPSKSVVPKLDDNDKYKPKYPDWLKDLIDKALEHADDLDDYFDTNFFSRLSLLNDAVNNAKGVYDEYLDIEDYVANHYSNIFAIGSGASDHILDVIVYNNETIETYKKHCINTYDYMVGQGAIPYSYKPELATDVDPRTGRIKIYEIYGALSLYDKSYYKMIWSNEFSTLFKYFPQTAGSAVPGGKELIDLIYSASSPYKILKEEN